MDMVPKAKNLKVGERVKIDHTASSLDLLEGRVVGTSSRFPTCNFNIVLLDQDYNGEEAINIIDSCLERV